MKNVLVNGTNYGYEVEKKATEKTGKIKIFYFKEKEVETETIEVRNVLEEEEKIRETRDKNTGELIQEKYIEKVSVRKEIPVITKGIETKPVKFGEVEIFTFLWPHQEKETVTQYILSKSK